MQEKKIPFSIVLPIYNVEKYLNQCLDSVVNQTLKNIEIICVNDGSTDNGLQILERYAALDSRIKIINKENAGLGAARNTGLDACHGEYVWFVDSDDFIDESACEKIYECAKKNESDIVLIDVGLYWTMVDPILDFLDTAKYRKMAEFGSFTVADAPWIQLTHSVWSRIYRRDFLNDNKLRNPEQRFGEDMLYSYMTAVYAKRISIVPEKLYFYRQNRKGSLLEQEGKNDEFKMMYLKSMRETKDFLKKSNTYDILKEDFIKSRVRWALPRQLGISNLSVFKQFFNELADILDKEDQEIIESGSFLYDYDGLKLYYNALKKGSALSYYIKIKLKKLCHKDYLRYYFRIPKTEFTIAIPRLHYFTRQENSTNRYEWSKIAYELAEMKKIQNELIKQSLIITEYIERKENDNA